MVKLKETQFSLTTITAVGSDEVAAWFCEKMKGKM